MAGSRSIAGSRFHPGAGRPTAIGLDFGGPVLEVARRGFSSTFSNQMGRLGGWGPAFDETTLARPTDHRGANGSAHSGSVLYLVDDVVGRLTASPGAGDVVSIGIAAPSWLGWCDRNHIVQLVDPHHQCRVVWASSPAVAVVASSLGSADPLASELVVAIDLDLGVSAALVAIDRTGVRELIATGASPEASNRLDAIATVMSEIAALARAGGMLTANRIVVVAADVASAPMVEQMLHVLDPAWAECPVDIVRSRADIARASVVLAEMPSFQIVGATPRAIGVLLDDSDTGHSGIHVVLPRNTATPTRLTASFDVGPDDGTQVYLDVYEELPDPPGSVSRPSDRRGHRLIMTARREVNHEGSADGGSADGDGAAPDDEVDVTFLVGTDGLFQLEATDVGQRSTWVSSWAVSRMVVPALPIDAQRRRALLSPGGSAGPGGGHAVGVVGDEHPVVPPPPPPGANVVREMAPPLGLSEVLGRVERILSRQVGRLVAIRSAMALFGSGDRDDLDLVYERADRLERALDRCAGDDASPSVHVAVEVARRALASPSGRVFAGGSLGEVIDEVQRVVEHLAIVVGAVTPAERNRLVLDAQLLGLDHDRARVVVDGLIDEAGVDRDGRPDELRDLTATVIVSADGFRLAPAEVRLDHDQAGIRVLVFDR